MIPPTPPVKVVFSDFVDLQTRIVLLPHVEEEGRGAVVASYTPLESCDERRNEENGGKAGQDDEGAQLDQIERVQSRDSMEDVDLETEEHKGDIESKEEVPEVTCSTSQESGDSPQESNPEDEVKSRETQSTQQDIVGKVLVGLHSCEEDEKEWIQKDFTEILSSIRDAPVPIVLFFDSALDSPSEESNHDLAKKTKESEEEVDDTSTESSASDCEENPAKSDPTQRNLFGERLSTWSSRMRATSAQLAAEAASGAASLSSKVVTAATEASERAKNANHQGELPPPHPDKTPSSQPPCRMYLQLASGKFAPIPAVTPARAAGSSAAPKVSTSSVLLIRKSEAEPCPPNRFRFQWYRSCDLVPSKDLDDRSRSSADDRSKSSSERSLNESVHSETEVEWMMLPGATYAAYQPSTTDVGHRVRCVVTMEGGDDDEDSDTESIEEQTETFELPEPVSADMALFNAARQALLRGAKFGNLKGRGNAKGRTFLVNVEISRSTVNGKKAEIASALKIYQVSTETSESLVENDGDAIMNASAESDPSHPKCFDLVFPSGLPGSASLVSALCTDGRFQLEAPNRITRETLLMALGIANYKGKPANLSVSTVLYPVGPSSAGSAKDGTDSSIDDISVGISTVSAITKDESIYCTPIASIDSPRSGSYDCNDRMQELEKELQRDLKIMRSKLAKKDRVVSDLQRQLATSDSQLQRTKSELSSSKRESERNLTCLKLAERRIETHEADMKRIKGDHTRHVSTLEDKVLSQTEKMAEMEKIIRSLQNEKAVLSAAVDARDSKLSRMEDLQSSVQSLNAKVAKGETLRSEYNGLYEKCGDLSEELEKTYKSEKESRQELKQCLARIEKLNSRVAEEQKRTAACQARLGTLGAETQRLKGERNSSKQKADSLAKEIARICRNGLQISDVERIVQDEESRRTEVSLLRAQKRKAEEELELYRTAFDQSVAAQSKANLDGEAVRALEQKAELERVVADLTEYVNAKEMQMETLKLVNASLQDEMRAMADKH